ncbi:hypothetical protein HAX54_011929 [Datura stramonium]|uniref:Uncharacterized protein n=1 Tax=Datura stramonium TaxID=4076 RepID=A0ABS8TKV0_DATST|nr:hypothetical protein [Datura stramonium]
MDLLVSLQNRLNGRSDLTVEILSKCNKTQPGAELRLGPSINGPSGTTEKQFHCHGCGHSSEMFRLKGKELHGITYGLRNKLEKKMISPSDACTFIFQFFKYTDGLSHFLSSSFPASIPVAAKSSFYIMSSSSRREAVLRPPSMEAACLVNHNQREHTKGARKRIPEEVDTRGDEGRTDLDGLKKAIASHSSTEIHNGTHGGIRPKSGGVQSTLTQMASNNSEGNKQMPQGTSTHEGVPRMSWKLETEQKNVRLTHRS